MTKRIACFTAFNALEAESRGAKAGCPPALMELMSQLTIGSWEVDLYSCAEEFIDLKVTLLEPGMRIIQVPAGTKVRISPAGKSSGSFVLAVQEFIALEGLHYDLIYNADLSSAAAAITLKDHYKIPLVYALPDEEHAARLKGADAKQDSTLKIGQQIVRRADLLLVESQQTKAELLKEHAASAKKIFVVPAGIDPEPYNPQNKGAAKARLQWGPEEQVLLHVAALNEYEGVDKIIKAMALLDAARLEIRLVVVNDLSRSGYPDSEDERYRLESMAQDLSLAKRVTFLSIDGQPALKDYYAAADILVTTPGNKSESLSAIQAMAFGTPVIGSDAPATNLGVLDGKTGFLVPTKAAEVLADRIALILSNEALLDQMRRNSVKHVRENFSWEQVADQMEDLLEYVILTKGRKELPVQKKTRGAVNRSNPARNLSLKRHIHARYGNS